MQIEGVLPVYQQRPYGARDGKLTAEKCVVFIIRSQFRVGRRNDYEKGQAHVVEDEKTIQLEQGAVVVIINLD